MVPKVLAVVPNCLVRLLIAEVAAFLSPSKPVVIEIATNPTVETAVKAARVISVRLAKRQHDFFIM